jgi:hypothetical protein
MRTELQSRSRPGYEIHLLGPLPDGVLEELDRLRVRAEGARTVLRGPRP